MSFAKPKTWVIIVLAMSILGVLLSSYSFLHNQGYASGSICAVNETFDCDVVNKGPHGDFFGIPVSLIGILGYTFLVLASIMKLRNESDVLLSKAILVATTGAFAFSLYLTSLEAFVLKAWCIICISSLIVITVAWISSLILFKKEKTVWKYPSTEQQEV